MDTAPTISAHMNIQQEEHQMCYFYRSIQLATHHIFAISTKANTLTAIIDELRKNVNLRLYLHKIEEKIPKDHPKYTPFSPLFFTSLQRKATRRDNMT